MSTFSDIATETPLEAYLRLRGDGGSFLLESVEHGRLGRHSFVGRGARIVSFEEAETCGAPVVGSLAYDHVAKLEPSVPLPAAGPPFAESRFVVADELIRFAHREDTPPLPVPPRAVHARVEPSPTYEELVRRAKEHIAAGDVFQVVLSQRSERRTSASAVELYQALRLVNPSPYLFLLELGNIALIGSSPETLVKVEEGRASVNPIAGTATPGREEELLRSEKDKAEHVMLVDLGRNDLSRVCRPGTVRVERFMRPERLSHVSHLVSEVTGELNPGVGAFELLRACFPAGTVSGAPKVRAMQLISELEHYRRGPYAGAVGYALPDGTLDTCIAIRTMVLANGVAYLQAGAGIVADSDPAAEHAECHAKLAALEQAIDVAEEARR